VWEEFEEPEDGKERKDKNEKPTRDEPRLEEGEWTLHSRVSEAQMVPDDKWALGDVIFQCSLLKSMQTFFTSLANGIEQER
jgi:hypothetical protein